MTRRSLLLGSVGLVGARRLPPPRPMRPDRGAKPAGHDLSPRARPLAGRLQALDRRDRRSACRGAQYGPRPHPRDGRCRQPPAQSTSSLLLGDYFATHRFITERCRMTAWAAELARLKAPLGVHAIFGNHDWWYDIAGTRRALADVNIPVLENDALLIEHAGARFWLAGIGDQIAIRLGPAPLSRRRRSAGNACAHAHRRSGHPDGA